MYYVTLEYVTQPFTFLPWLLITENKRNQKSYNFKTSLSGFQTFKTILALYNSLQIFLCSFNSYLQKKEGPLHQQNPPRKYIPIFLILKTSSAKEFN